MELRDRGVPERVEGEPGVSKTLAGLSAAAALLLPRVTAHARKGRCRGERTHIYFNEASAPICVGMVPLT
jgi:hypothetical protein